MQEQPHASPEHNESQVSDRTLEEVLSSIAEYDVIVARRKETFGPAYEPMFGPDYDDGNFEETYG